MLLVSGATATLERIRHPRLGRLMRPGNGNRPDALPWAADNGAYGGFEASSFEAMLERFAGARGCRWVAAPDVVAEAEATLAQFKEWEPRLHAAGWPIAFVAQDGLTCPPWDHFETLFVGGTTNYKLGPEVRRFVVEAKRRGKGVHMGRVNSVRRLRYAYEIGCDSVDGTKFSRFPDTWIPWALDWIDTIAVQGLLTEVVAS
jgi:hypothetical protein